MAITATIAANIQSTQTQTFTFDVVFSPPMGSDVNPPSFTVANIEVSGSSHISRSNLMVTSFANNTGVVTVRLPDNVSGSFTVDLIGTVSVVEGGSPSQTQEETIENSDGDPPTKLIRYDTRGDISAGFGSVDHHGAALDYSADVDIRFGEDVARFTRTDCVLERLAGDEIFGMDSFLTGVDREFELSLIPELGTVGVLELSLEGAATRGLSDVAKSVDVTPILVPFNARVPEIVDIEADPVVKMGTYDILWTLDHPSPVFVDADVLIFEGDIEGVDFGLHQPAVYRARSLDVKPEIPSEFSDPLSPPDISGEWISMRTGDVLPAVYILLRFYFSTVVSGQLNVSPSPDLFRSVTL